MSSRQRRKDIRRLRTAGITAAIIIAALIAFFAIFKIRSIEMIGNEYYDAKQITDDLIHDIWTENTLLFSWKYRNSTKESRTPYLDSVQAKLLSPSKVKIIVNEKKFSGYIQYAGENIYFDADGNVIEKSSVEYDKIPLVTGVLLTANNLDDIVLYQKLPVVSIAQFRTMLSITQLLIEADIALNYISFDDNLNLKLVLDRIEVDLGQDEYLEEKISNLIAIYPQLEGQKGVLHMESFTGKNEAITFEQEEAAPMPEESAAGTAGADENGEHPEGEAAEGSDTEKKETTGLAAFMVFDSSGTLRYDAHVVNGEVVDGSGAVIDGCSVTEDGYVKDAYWNIIDPNTGELAQ